MRRRMCAWKPEGRAAALEGLLSGCSMQRRHARAAAAAPPCALALRAAPQGPRAVVVLERVQSGLLGATLSSFGITGLYTFFVYGIARLLRLSTSDLRLKIPTEDLPSTRRLVTLCQVRQRAPAAARAAVLCALLASAHVRGATRSLLLPMPRPAQDVYIARSQGELVLEEELFAALIAIYRSPAVLFELTRKHKSS